MIVDTHTHFYDPRRQQGIPWPRPTDELLYRPCLPKHLKSLAVPHGVRGTIVVEASPWVEDNHWLVDLAEDEPFILGVVGNLDPRSATFAAHFEQLVRHPIFRGIRVAGPVLDDLSDTVLNHLQMLADADLALDLLVNTVHLPQVVNLAERLGQLRIVINHVARVPIGGRGVKPDPAWQAGMAALARCPCIYCKVSGLVERSGHEQAPADPAYYQPTIDVLWEHFGPQRLVYGSNWPVSERFAPYDHVFEIVKDYFGNKGTTAWANYFWANSQAAYRWGDCHSLS